MAGDVTPWLDLTTHQNSPKFMATLAAVLQPFADIVDVANGLYLLFDLDRALGQQLDVLGEWVGATRYLPTPLTGVYFALDEYPVLDEGHLKGPHDPDSGLTALADESYRNLIRATIARNNWDGTIPGAYRIWNALFSETGSGVLIQNLGGMQILYALKGAMPDAVMTALFTSGYFDLVPAGAAARYKTP